MSFDEAQERDMVLFIGVYSASQRQTIRKLSQQLGKKITALVLVDHNNRTTMTRIKKDSGTLVLPCDFSSDLKIEAALGPYKGRLLAVTTRAEKNLPLLQKVIPHVPYLNTPTELSLDWTTDKIQMRRLLRNYDKSISPKFLVAHDSTAETLDRIEKNIGFPLIIKPSGLAASLLVTICYHREELEANLRNTVRKINSVYKKSKGRGEPQILVEEFMEGRMYSIDCYINQRGVVYFTPLVHIKTGMSVGFDDFFGYKQTTPVNLKPHKVEAARKVASKAIEALGLRSVTAHVELMKTENGWKVIEVGARPGGFRYELYKNAYDIDHFLNDILIRLPKKPVINKKVRGHTAAMKFYAQQKGRLSTIEGINRVRRLESFQSISVNKKPGDMCDFARNGDGPVFVIILFNPTRSKLLADIRRLETTVRIRIKRPQPRTVQ